jgi:hypothetical protein
MISLYNITCPFLLFLQRGKMISAYVSTKGYIFTNRSSVWLGLFKKSYIIDAEGKKYNILSYKIRIDYIDLFTLIVDPFYNVYCNLSEPEQLSIDEIKPLVIDGLKCVGIKKKKVYTGISKAENVSQMVEIIVREYNRQIELNDEDSC